MTSRRASSIPARRGWPLLLVLGGGIFATATILFAVTGPFKSSNDKPLTRFVEASVGAPSRINPLFVHLDDVDRDVASLVFSGLTRIGPDGSVLPDLAVSWDSRADGSVTFHLRHGVRWQTGAPFTSADVLFTYDLLADRSVQTDPEQATLWKQVSCTAPDELTVACKLPHPFAPFLSYASVGILPKHILDSPTVAKTIFDDPFNAAPIGTGPFRLTELDQAHALLRSNPDYYFGRPAIDEFEFRFYPDVSSAAADVMRHQADGLLAGSSTSDSDYRALASTDGLKGYALNLSASTILYLNNGSGPLNDVNVRSAIARAIDVDAILGDVLHGRAIRADTPIVPGTWAFDTEAKSPGQDGGAARSLLDHAGWLLPNGAKVRRKSGQDLRITLMTDQDPVRGAIADEIARQLADVGIEASVVRQASTDLVRKYLIPRQYQAAIFGWDPGPDPDPYPAWHSSQASGNGRNLAAFINHDSDKLMEQARQTADQKARTQLYYRFQQLFLQQVPSVLLFYPVETYFVNDQVKGIQSGPLFFTSSRFAGVQKWTVQKSPDIR